MGKSKGQFARHRFLIRWSYELECGCRGGGVIVAPAFDYVTALQRLGSLQRANPVITYWLVLASRSALEEIRQQMGAPTADYLAGKTPTPGPEPLQIGYCEKSVITIKLTPTSIDFTNLEAIGEQAISAQLDAGVAESKAIEQEQAEKAEKTESVSSSAAPRGYPASSCSKSSLLWSLLRVLLLRRKRGAQ